MKTTILINKLYLLLIFSISSFNIHAANRYWVSSVASNWNNTANWSTTSGGIGGASVPITGDYVFFNGNGNGNCNLDVAVGFDGININSSYTGIIDLAGFAFNPSISSGATVCTFAGGTINDTPASSSVTFTTTSNAIFSGTTFNTPINATGAIAFNGGTYNSPVTVINNANNINGTGGCTFNSTLHVTNSGTSYFLMGITNPDIFNADVTFINTSTSRIRIAYNSIGTQFNGNIIVGSTAGSGVWLGELITATSVLASGKTISIDPIGFSDGDLRFRGFTQIGATPQTLSLTGTAQLVLDVGSVFNGNIDMDAPQILINQSTFNGTVDVEKTGAGSNNSNGGNIFNANTILQNSGSGYFLMGNGNPDIFNANLTINNNGTNNMYLAHNSIGNIVNGTFIINNNTTGVNSSIYTCTVNGSSLTVNGACTVNDNSASTNNAIYLGFDAPINFGSTLTINHNSTSTSSNIYLANGVNSSSTVAGLTTVINSGAGTTKRIWLGNQGDVTFNGSLNITNSSSATNSAVYCNYNDSSTNFYNENIVVESTNANSDGVLFGSANGKGTLAVTKTITIGGGGFIAGELHFRNFTQVGATNHTLLATGTAEIENYDSDWGGNIDFRAPQILTRGTRYRQTTFLEKTGAINNPSVGGNYFTGNTQLLNSGSGYFLMGNGSPDSCLANLDLQNTGNDNMYLGYNSSGNFVSGNLTINNSGTGLGNTYIYVSQIIGSSLVVNGATTISNLSSSTNSNIYFGDQGSITLNGSLTAINNTIGDNGHLMIGNNSNSLIIVNGNSTITNSGGGTTKRTYLGNQGSITFNGTLNITNSSFATNSQIYCNNGINSIGLYNDNIVVESTNAASAGILFGAGTGKGTLAATKTITIGGGGFIAGELEFRNFTQVGPTNHTLLATGTATIENIDSDWGGNVDFRAPRLRTTGTLYRQTAILEKTDALDDYSVGGNTFTGNAQLINSGSGYFLMGANSPDSCLANLDILNSGTDIIYYAYNSPNNIVGGNLTISNTANGTNSGLYICNNTVSTLTVSGNTSLTNSPTSTNSTVSISNIGTFTCNGNFTGINSGSGNTHNVYLGNVGSVVLGGNCNITNASTATSSIFFVASNAAGSAVINGSTNITNSGTGTTSRIYFGSDGDITTNGTLTILNNSSATNSQIYCNNSSNSIGLYNENIVVESTNANSDGILFGVSNGKGTLAATKTITIGGAGFIAGQLYFRNFTQIGPTNHTLLATGTAEIENYTSDWGGNVNFRAPRMFTRGTLYRQTAILEKTDLQNDYSYGGNIFTGNAQLINSGSGYFLMGGSLPDSCLSNLDLLNSGTYYMYYAYNSLGNFIAGNLTVNNTASGVGNTNISISTATSSTLDIIGTTNITNSTTSNNGDIYLGDQGDITLNNTLTLLNNTTGNSGTIYVANNTNSEVIINASTSLINNGAGITKRAYLGNQGDITFNGTLSIVNNSSATNSQIFCNQGVNSLGLYNDDITIENTNALGDGVLFGNGTGSGILAATKTITIGGGGFVAGDLYFRNFTQLSATPQNLAPTGTTTFTNYNSLWNGNVDFRSPRMLTHYTTYNGTSFLQKNGASNDASVGGNTFNDDATFQNTSTAGYFMPANATPNDFNANATYIKSNAGLMYPTYNCTSTYAGNITINSNSTILFGAAGNGRVLFDGSTPQSVNVIGPTPTPEFRDFQTNNLISDIKLNTPVIVITELDLDNGHVITDATNLLIMNDNAIVSSAGVLAFVDGPIRKIGNDAFNFPVGKNDTAYAPISMSAPINTTHHFTAEYFQINPDSTLPTAYTRTLKDPTLNHISACEYWMLDRTNGTSNVNVTLSWDNRSCGVSNLGDLRVARWNGALWKDHGNGGTTGTTVSGTVVTSAPVNSFSPFTLASATRENPLPVKLLSFDAQLNNNIVDLTWQTATEINNDYFTLEKSKDGFTWIAFAEQNGAGNSNTLLNYADVDINPYTGVSYYRLKQTDYNGDYAYSNIISINNLDEIISVYPNPVKDILNINNLNETHIVKVFAIDGRIIFEGNTPSLNTNNWSNGIYELIIFNQNGEIAKRLKIVK